MTSQPALNTLDPLIGSTIAGRYRIQARVGSGAMGAVYRAVQSGLGRPVALKVLKRDLAFGGDTVQRFRREAHAMSALNHPNTVRVFDFGATDQGLLYLAMELLEGEPVTERLLNERALSVKQSVLFAQQVLRSVGEAHAKGIVHRDLKPDNIFLAHVQGEPEPIVKVLDFGIAKAVEGERKIDQFETLDGTVFGTPRYMAPEQAAGKSLDPRTDLYAVGIILYEFLAGHPPFVDSDAVVVMAKHIREPPVALCKAAPQRPIPRSLEAVVAKALEKEPHKRFQSADEFDQALTRCLPDIERLERSDGEPTLLERVSRVSRLPHPRGRTWLLAGAVLLAALLVVGLYAAWPDPSPAATSPVAYVRVPSAELPAQAIHDTTPTPQATDVQGSAPATTSSVVTLRTEPSAAEVWRDGVQLGITPLEVVVPAGATTSVSLHKTGFVDHTVELAASPAERTVMLASLPAASRATPRATHAPRLRRTRAHSSAGTGTASSTAPDSPYEKF